MRSQLLKAFAYYRERCQEQIIVFHQLHEYFICTDKDEVLSHPTFQALTHHLNLGNDSKFDVVVIDDNEVKNALDLLYEQDFSVRTIEYKNGQKESKIPNVDDIPREQGLDY